MPASRGPLQPISNNVLQTPNDSPSSSKGHTANLAPIFTPTPSRSSLSTPRRIHALRDVVTSSSTFEVSSNASARKRVKRDHAAAEDQTDHEEEELPERCSFGRKSSSMMNYFCPSTPLRDSQPRSSKRVEPVQSDQIAESNISGLWRRKRGRLGVGTSRSDDLLSMGTRTRKSQAQSGHLRYSDPCTDALSSINTHAIPVHNGHIISPILPRHCSLAGLLTITTFPFWSCTRLFPSSLYRLQLNSQTVRRGLCPRRGCETYVGYRWRGRRSPYSRCRRGYGYPS